MRHSAVSASPTGPPNTPECACRSSIATSTVTSTSPRRLVVSARDVDGGVRRVRDDDDVAGQGVAVLVQQRGEGGGARLLLALDEQRDPDRRPALVGAQHREVGHHAGLVVGGAAAVEAPVALGRLERRGGPQLVAAGGLHVVVGVEQHGRGAGRCGPVRDDRRGAALRGDDPHVLAARVPRQRGDGLGAAPGVVGVRGIGPDARDADEPFEVGPAPGSTSITAAARSGSGSCAVRHAPMLRRDGPRRVGTSAPRMQRRDPPSGRGTANRDVCADVDIRASFRTDSRGARASRASGRSRAARDERAS